MAMQLLPRRPASIAALLIFICSAYLTLFNLGHAPLWHDEAIMGSTAKNIVRTGGYNGWDGRNMLLTTEGASVNSNFTILGFPPWPPLPSALGILLFGANEVGVRFFHSILGLLSLLVFWRLLRLEFPARPRLRVLAFALFALSTQVILFMRLGRYAADALLFSLLTLYAYRVYIDGGGGKRHLAVAALCTVLGFLNHFQIGAAFAVSLALWHLLYRFRQTSRRQWIEIGVAGVLCAGLCLYYLVAAGIILSDERLEYWDLENEYLYSWHKRKLLLIFYNFREMLSLGWLPFFAALWVLWLMVGVAIKSGGGSTDAVAPNPAGNSIAADNARIAGWAVLLMLFLVVSGLMTIRVVHLHKIADSRYIVPALPLAALLTAACVDWLWRKFGARMALPVLCTLLLSNVLSYPIIHANLYSDKIYRWLLPNLIREIHRPYENYTTDIIRVMEQHAAQDDTIYIHPWQDHAALLFYLGDKMIFCCLLDEESVLPEEKVRALGAPLYKGDVMPEWYVVVSGDDFPDLSRYVLIEKSYRLNYPTQRPELEYHLFESPAGLSAAVIYKKKPKEIEDN